MTDTNTTGTKTDEFDEWGGESGFKDNFPGLVTDGWYAKDSAYNNGETLCLMLKVLADDGEEVDLRYPCGQDWDSYDNGETAEHPKDKEGRPKSFNHNSAMFGLMSHAFEAGAEGELRKRGRPRVASIWRGLKFFWIVESQTFNIKDRQTGEDRKITTSRTYPKEFLGVFDVDTGGATSTSTASTSPASTQTPVSSPPASSPSASPTAEETVGFGEEEASSNGSAGFDISKFDPAMIAKLKIHAKAKAYPEFLDHAMTVDGVTTNDDLLDLLGQEPFYAHLRG